MPTARALAIAGDRIAGGVGTHETALASPERVDLGGRCVRPGFNDSHVHFPTWSLAQRQVRLEGTRTLDEALEHIARAARDIEPGRWLRGTGWRSGDWSPEVEPTKEALDRVTGDTPSALMARDYHSLWINSAALALADGNDLDADGGVVERDARGEPTGVLREECAWDFRDTYVRPTEDEMVEASREGVRLAVSRGVTAVHDKDGWLGALGVWQRLRDEGALKLRVWQSLPADQLDAFEETRGVWHPLGLRPRIEHAQLLTWEDVPRFAELGVAASVQFSHAPSDAEIADRFWAGMTERAYAYRSLWDAGALVANGSDAPIEELDPWAGVIAGVTRAWHQEQRLTLDEALQATTVNPAWLASDERRRGKLLPGYLADLVVLDADPYGVRPEGLSQIAVVATMVGGRWVHNPPPWD